MMVFRKPKEVGPYGTPSGCKHPVEVTDLDDYKSISSVFKSSLLSDNKYISTYDLDTMDEDTIIVGGTSTEGKRKVTFTDNIKFSKHCLKHHEVESENLDKDTTVYFIDADTSIQAAINTVKDGDVVALLADQTITAPLTCDNAKNIIVDMCGCNILCDFEGEAETSDNLDIRNTVPESGEIKKYVPEFVADITLGKDGYDTIADAVAALEVGQILAIPAGIYDENIVLDKAVSIIGAGVDNTTLSGYINISAEEGDALISNVKFSGAQSSAGTGNGKRNSSGSAIIISGNANVTIKDAAIEGEKYFYSIINIAGNGKIVIDNVAFGDNECYHAIEWGTKIKVVDGTTISNCSFTAGTCTHNGISMYDFEEGATVELNNNTFGDGDSYRFSNISGAACTLNVANNTYTAVDTSDGSKYYELGYQNGKWWSGLLFQAYIDGMDFSKMVVNITNMIAAGHTVTTPEEATCAEEQAYYVFKDDPSFTVSNPVVNIA
jgi:hypothetical protein